MTKLLLIIVLVLNAGLVLGGWDAVEKRYQTVAQETVYYDPATIHRESTRATLWQLTDIKWNSTTRFLSFTTHKEFDCERSRVRVLQVVGFSRQMGTGRSAPGFIENGNWQTVDEHSANHALWRIACGTG
ncbi:MAG: hypothetical protein A4E19_18355 [Nitrospira sp. SG-bin1]|nr:MAG: hypothetical protein A4E19_18355 [Nitrospira sp. SG-bin1]